MTTHCDARKATSPDEAAIGIARVLVLSQKRKNPQLNVAVGTTDEFNSSLGSLIT